MAGSGGEHRICLGAIAGSHGVRGQVKVKSFTEIPEDIAAYGPLWDEAGERSYRLALKGTARGLLIVAIEGLRDREAAQALKGTRLYVDRAALPETADEELYYHVDLIGLSAQDEAGAVLGPVTAVNNHGAGDYLEIESALGPTRLIPFTRAAVPSVDLAAGRLVVAAAALAAAMPEPGPDPALDPGGEDPAPPGSTPDRPIGPKARERTGQKTRERS